MSAKDTIKKSTYLKNLAKKDREIELLREIISNYKGLKEKLGEIIWDNRHREDDFKEFKKHSDNIILDVRDQLRELTRFTLESYRLLDEFIRNK